jgi:hypothetical protein
VAGARAGQGVRRVRTCCANSGDTLVSGDKYTWSQCHWVWLTARLSRAARRALLGLDAEFLLRARRRTSPSSSRYTPCSATA